MSEDVLSDPKTKRLNEFVGEMLAVKRKYGLTPTEARINPTDNFLVQFKTICGLKVVHDYTVPKDNVVIL